jgi:hypothetical protein
MKGTQGAGRSSPITRSQEYQKRPILSIVISEPAAAVLDDWALGRRVLVHCEEGCERAPLRPATIPLSFETNYEGKESEK